MKLSSSSLIAVLVAASAGLANAAPGVQATSSMQNNHYWTDSERMVYGPKVNPGVIKQHGGIQVNAAGVGASSAAMGDGYCGNGIVIPGKKPGGGGPITTAGGSAGVAMNDPERCGTRVPGRIPGGVGPGPR